MPALKQYTSNSPQSGVYIVANVGGSHPVTLQVTHLGRRIFERLGYTPGDDVPTRFVWSLYDVGILYTKGTLNQDPELPADPAEVFEELAVPGKLTAAERAELIAWLAEYNGPHAGQVSSLRETLKAERSDEKASVDATNQQSDGTRVTTTEPPSTSKDIAGRFLDIEMRAAGYTEIPDQSQESYIECFVLLIEVSNYADADWDFNPRKELTVTTHSGTSLGKPLEPFPRELGEYSAGGTTISPSASRQIVLIYPAEDGSLDIGQLEYTAKLLHRHAGISHNDPTSSDYERISIDIDADSLPPLPEDLNLNQVWLALRTEASIERATAIEIDLVGYEWSEREQIMFVFVEVENNTPTALSPMLADFTVVAEDGYTFMQHSDGSYNGLPNAWATVTIIIPTGARGRVMLPFGTDKPFIPKRLLLERSDDTVEVEFDTKTIEDTWGAPESVDVSEIEIDFR